MKTTIEKLKKNFNLKVQARFKKSSYLLIKILRAKTSVIIKNITKKTYFNILKLSKALKV
jgi:hypothetical protein